MVTDVSTFVACSRESVVICYTSAMLQPYVEVRTMTLCSYNPMEVV
jgi:hypothetical protein